MSTVRSDVDATNLAVTFTVPVSGRVLVRLTCESFAGTRYTATNRVVTNQGRTDERSITIAVQDR